MSTPSARSAAASRAAANRRKGTRWETDLRDNLRNQGEDAERLKLTGKEDEGDLVVRRPTKLIVPEFVIIEAKDAAMDVATFVREAIIEADHYASHRPSVDRATVTGIAVVKRRGKNWREAYVLTTLGEYLGHRA